MTIDLDFAKITGGTYETPEISSEPSEPETSSNPSSLETSAKPQENISLDLNPLLQIWSTVYTDIQNRGNAPKYPTGLKELDNVIWGLHKRELVTMGARTSHGKSAMALQMAMSMADINQRTVYFSLEMSKEQLVERMLAHFCKIDNRWLRHGLAKERVEINKRLFENHIEGLKLLIDDQYGYWFDNIVKVCELVRPDFIFIDYIQMVSTKGYKSKLDAIEEYVRQIKQLANAMNFGVILISQINRSGEDEMTMANLKGAGVLEEHSDTVILLRWDWQKGEYEVRVDKQRHGEVKTVHLEFEPEYFVFKDKIKTPPPVQQKDFYR